MKHPSETQQDDMFTLNAVGSANSYSLNKTVIIQCKKDSKDFWVPTK